MKTKQFFTIFLFLVIIWPAASYSVEVGEASPTFVLKTLDNRELRSENFKGENPMFLIFWATWCPICKGEIPKINKLYSAYEPKGMTFLAINVGINDSEARAKRYAKKYKISYPVAFDEESRVTKLFNVQGTPTIIITDRRGIVRYRSGAYPDDLAEHFESLIK